MRRIKQKSIVKYVATYFFAILLALSAFLLCFSLFFLHNLVHMSIQREITLQLRQNAKYISYEKETGRVNLDERFNFEEGGWRYVILDLDGNVLFGEYPDGFPRYQVKDAMLKKIRLNGDFYYVKDYKKGKNPVILRCFVKSTEINDDSLYIFYVEVALVLVVLIGSLIVWRFLERHELKQVNEVSDVIRRIGKAEDLSARIEYDGRFSEIESLANANNRMLDRLEEIMRNQERFTSDVAHELRTPITVLMAESEYLKRENLSREEVEESHEVIDRQSKKMHQIVTQVLSMAKLEQDSTDLEREWISIDEVVQSVCEEILSQTDKPVSFAVSIHPELEFRVNVELITILIQNLIDNAVKYSPDQAKVSVSAEDTGEEWLLRIWDEGIGIRKEDQKAIFETFYRVEKNSQIEGYGLGLPMVQRIAMRHGGKVTVESEPGKGSVFCLHIPGELKED